MKKRNLKKNPDFFRLRFSVDGKICYEEWVEKGTRLTSLPKVSKKDATFSGWGEVPSRMPAEDLILEGFFQDNIYQALFFSGVDQYGLYEETAGTPITPPKDPQRDGYVFVGWKNFTGVMPSENAKFEALFEPKTYQLTYLIDNTYRMNYRVVFGEPCPVLENPTKEHFEFSGWDEIPKVMPPHDTIVRGLFLEKRYSLKLIVDGELFQEYNLPFGAPLDKKIKPQKEGYYFSGWRKMPDTMPEENLVLQGSLYPTRYKVDFYLNRELFHTVYVPFGGTIPLPTVHEEKNQIFTGWGEIPSSMPAKDLTIEGQLTQRMHTIMFVADDREIKRVDLHEGDVTPKDIKAPEKDGHIFSHWDGLPDVMPDSNITVFAEYIATKMRYEFYIDGDLVDAFEPEEGSEITLPEMSQKEGKDFSGWTVLENDASKGVCVYSGTYGSEKLFHLTYEVRGESFSSSQYHAGDLIQPPQAPLSDEFDFLGWNNLPEVMPPKDIVVRAKLHINKPRIRFILDEELFRVLYVEVGSDIPCPSVEPREGYTFSGWENVPKKMVATDLTIHGSFSLNKHTLTFEVDGDVIATDELSFGSTITYPEILQEKPDGSKFLGWSFTGETMPAQDLTINGTYTDVTGIIHLIVDGEESDKLYQRIGEKLILPTIPVKPGEHFEWDNPPEYVPKGETIVHGGHIQDYFTITYFVGDMKVGEEHYRYNQDVRPKVLVPKLVQNSFLEWEHIPEKMPDENIVVTAKLSDKKYHITFMLEKSFFFEADVAAGAPTPNPEVPEKSGFRFEGWKNYSEKMPSYNFTAYGSYVQESYTITYMCSNRVFASQEYSYGDAIVPMVAPEREGFNFRVWEGLPRLMPAKDLVVSARYEGLEFPLIYQLSGQVFQKSFVEMGTRIIPLDPPPKPGCVFTGWKDVPEFMPEEPLTILGQYEERSHTVTYKINGIIYRIDTYEVGATITSPIPPEREHEKFVGWKNFTNIMPEYDFICSAVYSEAYAHYTFVIDGKILLEGTRRKGEKLTPPNVPRKSGMVFAGWKDFNGIMPGQDTVFIGTYKKDDYRVFYELDGEKYQEEAHTPGDLLECIPSPSKVGYTFSGWSSLPKEMPEDDVYVKGYLVPQQYSLQYKSEGKVIYSKMTACGTPLRFLEGPAVFGREFNGWQEEPKEMPPAPLTVEGSYSYVTPIYKNTTVGVDASFGTENEVDKKRSPSPDAIALLTADTLLIILEGNIFPVSGSTSAIVNGHVVDEERLALAIRATYRKYGLPKKKLQLIIDPAYDADAIFDTNPMILEDLSRAARELFSDSFIRQNAVFRFNRLSVNRYMGTERIMVSLLDKELGGALMGAFKFAGVSISQTSTLHFSLVQYLQFNPFFKEKKNQICLFYLPKSVIGILMISGQVAIITQNQGPYETRKFDIKTETRAIFENLAEYYEQMGMKSEIDMLGIGGIDRAHINWATRHAEKQLKSFAQEKNVFMGKKLKHINVVQLGFARTE